ncbi:MAG: nucleotide exchange factor GrpE [Nitrospinae bacterium]|nr:nucleotide exchange factor GrpE [Nitrospinota bacterium]
MSDDIKVKVLDKRHWVNPEALEKDTNEQIDLKRHPHLVAKLEEQMAENDKQLKEYIAAYKQKMAENDEFRARLQKDVEKRVDTATASFFRETLPLMDQLDMALSSAEKTRDAATLLTGLKMIQSGFVRTFAEFGLTEVECEGKPFNPAEAEALQVMPVSEREKDNTVIEVVQPGFRMKEMLIRPAKVIVGKYSEF